MEVKADGPGTDPEFYSHEGGLSWIAHPTEGMQRASHALSTDAGVWLVDPVDTDGLDDRIAQVGDVTGVVVLLNRHERDSARIARRHDVSISRPPGITREFDAPVEEVTTGLAGSAYECLSVKDWPGWREVGLWDGDTLVVPESLGTNAFCRVGDEAVGLNPFARLAPPKHLRTHDPTRVLVGHGPPVLDDAGHAMRDALRHARSRLPRAWLGAIRELF